MSPVLGLAAMAIKKKIGLLEFKIKKGKERWNKNDEMGSNVGDGDGK